MIRLNENYKIIINKFLKYFIQIFLGTLNRGMGQKQQYQYTQKL